MKCDRCPMGEGPPCAGESGEWAGLACKMAEQGTDASARWIAERSGAEVAAPPAPEPPAYPPLATQAANLAKAAGRFVASGLATVDRAEYDRRKGVCFSCPTGQHDRESDRCFRCGCMLEYKRRSEAEHCPDGHW